MPTNLFNFGGVLDRVLANTNSLLAGQKTIEAAIASLGHTLQADDANLFKAIVKMAAVIEAQGRKIDALYSAAFGIPVTIGLDFDSVVSTRQPTPTKPGP